MTTESTVKRVAICLHISLLVLMTGWYTVFQPSSTVPAWLPTLLLAAPLLFPIRGLLAGKRYTYGWLPLLMMLYRTHGIMEGWSNPADRVLAFLELMFSLGIFCSCVLYLRITRYRR